MLKELFDKHQCDKGTLKHHYYKDYEPYFEDIRLEPLNFLEIGTLRGASTKAFYHYFPNANIYTMDLFKKTGFHASHPKLIKILRKDRVHWMQADSMDKYLGMKIRDQWGQDIKFDIIIDDGAHWPEANRLTFENLVPFLKDEGTYFIEDVWPMDRLSSDEIQNKWVLKHPDKYDMSKYNRLLETLDDYETTHHDRRSETEHGDTYIIAINKK